MASVLIVHASQEGQTLRIAERLADTLRLDGHDVRLMPALPFPGIGDADGVIVAASVHLGRHPGALVRAVRAHRTVLEQLPSAFLSICLSAAGETVECRTRADSYLHAFLRRTGWRPALATTLAGALRFSRYGYLKARWARVLARRQRLPPTDGRDHEFTDWDDVRRFAEAYSALLTEVPRPHVVRRAGRTSPA